MTAPVEQLRRWQALLTYPPSDGQIDAVSLAADREAAGGLHRPFIVSCLRIVDAVRRDVEVPRKFPLAGAPQARRPAAEGSDVAGTVWGVYVLHVQQVQAADEWLRAMIGLLQPTALVVTPQDNLEPWWQNEMLILHALHSFALRTREPALLEKTLACADFHLREIQPDHATNEPWSIHAYASHPDGNVTAETLLHAGHIQHGGTLGPVARLIARDASGALEAYLAP